MTSRWQGASSVDMEDGGRGFTEIRVAARGVQSGKERFSVKEDRQPPEICQWRNNLTALSQRYNLYFIAYIDEIYIYRPQFPTQSLPSRPDLVLRLPASEANLSGHIDHTHPHSVNNILIGDLGDEEILACVCDDGDVLAFHTRTVFNAVEWRSCPEGFGDYDGANPRPFFNENVGLSAWGVAVHKASRMIAVSANTHDITVFAFALSSGDTDISEHDRTSALKGLSGSTAWKSVTRGSPRHARISPSQRAENIRILLEGHKDNVPNITFCNTDDDEEGQWLMSTAIDGEMVIWDIWLRKEIKRHQFGPPPGSLGTADVIFNRFGSRGWGVICLDTRAFRLTRSTRETFGCIPKSRHGFWDISASRADVEDASVWHAAFSRSKAAWAQEAVLHDDDDYEASMYDSEETDNDVDESNIVVDVNEGFQVDESEPNHILIEGDLQEDALSLIEPPMEHENTTMVSLHPTDATQPGTSPRRRAPVKIMSGRADNRGISPDEVSESKVPRCAVMHTSERDVRFLQNPMVNPTVVLQRPLMQNLPPNLQWLDRFDRLNMFGQIPELGIVLVATQTGRVALLTLTRMASTKQLAFRLDALLPFQSQENEGCRPDVPLLGMAFGPIQGREMMPSGESGSSGTSDREESWRGIESSRRYRLMLTYYDHTVLSYEIERLSTAASIEKDQLLAL